MSNSQKNPKDNGSVSVINESLSLTNKGDTTVDGVELKQNNHRKYQMHNVFRNFFCCSCFNSEENHKYVLSKSDKEPSSKSRIYDSSKDKVQTDLTEKNSEELKSNDDKLNNSSSNVLTNFSKNNFDKNRENQLKQEDFIVESRSSDCYDACDKEKKLLPEASENNKNKKCFVIDLDETLVHSSYGYVKTADINVTVDIDGIQQKVYVCKRPFVDEFIEEVGQLFECVLFTASLGKYADPVTDFLDPDQNVFASRLFREACSYRDGNYIKDLDILGRDTNQVLILDNSPVSYWLHPRHAIQIISWFDDPRDTALRDLLPYLRSMAASPLNVVEFLEANPLPPDSVGILGHPPSGLHWLLAQYHNVSLATSIHQQQQHQHQLQHRSSTSSNDDEEEDDEDEQRDEEVDVEEDLAASILVVAPSDDDDCTTLPAADNTTIADLGPVSSCGDSDGVSSDGVTVATNSRGESAGESTSLHSPSHQDPAGYGTANPSHDLAVKGLRQLTRQSLPHNNQKSLNITKALKDYRRKSQAALDDELHRPPVSSPVARPKSEFHPTPPSSITNNNNNNSTAASSISGGPSPPLLDDDQLT